MKSGDSKFPFGYLYDFPLVPLHLPLSLSPIKSHILSLRTHPSAAIKYNSDPLYNASSYSPKKWLIRKSMLEARNYILFNIKETL